MDFDEQGNRVSGYGQLLVMPKRGRGRPRKIDTAELDKIALNKPANDYPLFQQKLDTAELDKIALNKPANDCPPFQQKRGRGRPRKLDTAELDKIALNKPANDCPPFQQKRGRGRPRKLDTSELDKIALSEPAGDFLIQKRGRGRPRKNSMELQSKPAGDFLIQKRSRGRPRKNLVESDIPVNLKENYISDVKEKLKLLETITNEYREIERIDKETQKNVEKLCAMMHNSK